MTFLEALSTGRPMRRYSRYTTNRWIFLGRESLSPGSLPRWHHIDTGSLTGLSADDYKATDWEVMP